MDLDESGRPSACSRQVYVFSAYNDSMNTPLAKLRSISADWIFKVVVSFFLIALSCWTDLKPIQSNDMPEGVGTSPSCKTRSPAGLSLNSFVATGGLSPSCKTRSPAGLSLNSFVAAYVSSPSCKTRSPAGLSLNSFVSRHLPTSWQDQTKIGNRPNIVVIMGDDWSWPHASILGDPVVSTPTFDRIANEGVLFENAFVAAPSCTTSRMAFVSGQYPWRLGSAANLGGSLAADVAVYPELLAT